LAVVAAFEKRHARTEANIFTNVQNFYNCSSALRQLELLLTDEQKVEAAFRRPAITPNRLLAEVCYLLI